MFFFFKIKPFIFATLWALCQAKSICDVIGHQAVGRQFLCLRCIWLQSMWCNHHHHHSLDALRRLDCDAPSHCATYSWGAISVSTVRFILDVLVAKLSASLMKMPRITHTWDVGLMWSHALLCTYTCSHSHLWTLWNECGEWLHWSVITKQNTKNRRVSLGLVRLCVCRNASSFFCCSGDLTCLMVKECMIFSVIIQSTMQLGLDHRW